MVRMTFALWNCSEHRMLFSLEKGIPWISWFNITRLNVRSSLGKTGIKLSNQFILKHYYREFYQKNLCIWDLKIQDLFVFRQEANISIMLMISSMWILLIHIFDYLLLVFSWSSALNQSKWKSKDMFQLLQSNPKRIFQEIVHWSLWPKKFW